MQVRHHLEQRRWKDLKGNLILGFIIKIHDITLATKEAVIKNFQSIECRDSNTDPNVKFHRHSMANNDSTIYRYVTL